MALKIISILFKFTFDLQPINVEFQSIPRELEPGGHRYYIYLVTITKGTKTTGFKTNMAANKSNAIYLAKKVNV